MKLNKIFLTVILLTIMVIGAACSLVPVDEPGEIGIANPASVYCIEQGGELEIRKSKDGGEYGVCIFDDGSECDEWAFFNEQCSPGTFFPAKEVVELPAEEYVVSEDVTALYGVVVSPSTKGSSDSLLVLTSDGFPSMFVAGETGEIEDMIQSLKDKSEPANKANFWGHLDCPTVDQCLLTVTRMKLDGPGEEEPAEKIEGWTGMVYSGPEDPHSGGDDYFALLDGEFPFQYGIWSMDEAINEQLEELRDSGQVVQISGELFAGRMDWNATQIVVTQIEIVD